MIPEGIEGCGRDRVDGVLADQFFDIEHVAVVRILGAGARPQHALGLCALLGQRFPTRPAENFQITLVGELSVGDSDFAENVFEKRLLGGILFSLKFVIHDRVDQRVDAADEKARHDRYSSQVAPIRGELLQSRNVSFGDFFVDFLGKQ